jgi:uncharacterized protein (TIGR02186 family)
MFRTPLLSVILLAFLLSLAPTVRAGGDRIPLIIEPDHIQLGFFYGGQNISVRANVPAGYNVLFKVKGATQNLELKKKRKVLGFLWMNVGDVVYEDVPGLYVIRSSHPFVDLAPANVLQQMEIGYSALKAKIVKPPDDEAGMLFADLIKLKEGEGVFTIVEGGIRHAPMPGSREQIVTEFLLPPKAPVGEYLVDLYGFKNGSSTLLGSGSITLERDHLIQFITSMVGHHSLLYGCLAVMVAIVAGLLTGVIFRLSRGRAH